ncbi:MAG: alanyl-tRNA synthetase, partial [Gaiellaceae bacterium]|nr:alanyl-tRNA synthetase [Gaiellaceae bacterium]
ERARKQKPKQTAQPQAAQLERVGAVVLAETSGVKGGELRDLSDRIRQQEKADGAIVASVTDGRIHIVVNLAEGLGDASKIANEMGQIVGGKGGGRPTMAQAGGDDADAIPQAFAAAKAALA